MIYTILAAQFGNEDHTSAVIQTLEAGDVAASVTDTPDLWAQMLASVEPADFEGPLQSQGITYKADIWRRATPDEVPVLVALLDQQPLKQQMIFRDCEYIDHGDPEFPVLKAGVAMALNSETRANELLAPSV